MFARAQAHSNRTMRAHQTSRNALLAGFKVLQTLRTVVGEANYRSAANQAEAQSRCSQTLAAQHGHALSLSP